jgi:hypothetical protein
MILSVFTIVLSSSKDSNSAWFSIGSRNNYRYGYLGTGDRRNQGTVVLSWKGTTASPPRAGNTLAVPTNNHDFSQ